MVDAMIVRWSGGQKVPGYSANRIATFLSPGSVRFGPISNGFAVADAAVTEAIDALPGLIESALKETLTQVSATIVERVRDTVHEAPGARVRLVSHHILVALRSGAAAIKCAAAECERRKPLQRATKGVRGT